MKTYAEFKLADRVLILSDMTSMVKCVEKLPDLTEDSEGWICQLTGTQPGYIATHIYKCVKLDNDDLIWVDITSSTEMDEATELSTPKFKKVTYSDGGLRIIVIWEQPEPTSNTEVWERDVLIRKLDSVPTSPIDGEVLTNDIDTNEDKRCIYVSNFLNNPSGDYKYRIFHMYQSGRVTYTEIPGVDDPKKNELSWSDIKYLTACGVVKKIFSVGDTLSVKGSHTDHGNATWNLRIDEITDPSRTGSVVTGSKVVLNSTTCTGDSWYTTASVNDVRATLEPEFLKIFTIDSDLVLYRETAGTIPSITATITNV